MKKLNFEKMVENEFGLKPNRYIIETEDGTILKVDESYSEGQVIQFMRDNVVHWGNPTKLWESPVEKYQLYQGFVKECTKLKFEWDGTTEVDEIYYALVGNPIPVSLVALLVKQMLSH